MAGNTAHTTYYFDETSVSFLRIDFLFSDNDMSVKM